MNSQVGLGEYKSSELLAELVERGVMQEIMGNDEDWRVQPTAQHEERARRRNALRHEQLKRIQDILGGKK